MSIRQITYDRLHHYASEHEDVTGCGLVERLLAEFLDAEGVPEKVPSRRRPKPEGTSSAPDLLHPACFTF